MLHILIKDVSNKLADFLVKQVISSSQNVISDSTVTITPR